MSTLPMHGMHEIDGDDLAAVRGGNAAAVALAGLMASSFGWGVRFGYTKVGPWLLGHA